MDPLITTIRPCPICACQSSLLLHHHPLLLPDQLNYLPDCFNIVECISCHMVFNDSSITPESLTRYYTSPYYTSNRPYRDDAARIEQVARYIGRYATTNDLSVLDIGAGDQQLSRELTSWGFYVQNYDIGDGPLSGSYDIGILNHVLEHVYDPKSFINQIVTPHIRTYLYIEVPDTISYGLSSYNSFAYFNFEHINHFTIEHLVRLLGMPKDWGWRWVEIVPGYHYPVIYGWWLMNTHKDNDVDKYINESKNSELKLLSRIKSQLNGRKTIYIRGYSNRAWSLIPKLLSQHIYIAGVIDAAPNIQQFTLNNIPVLRPQDELLDYPILVVADTPWVEEQMASEYLNIHEVIR